MIWFLCKIAHGDKDGESITGMHARFKEHLSEHHPYQVEIEVMTESNLTCVIGASKEPRILSPMKLVAHSNRFLFIGDMRIDNRAEISALLDGIGDQLSDPEMFLILYERYAGEAFSHIVGEFTCVIWEKDTSRFHATRDHLGMRTLFWIENQGTTWIASDIFLLQDQFSMEQINDNYFHSFYMENGCVDSVVTPYQGVNRVPSGHLLGNDGGSLALFQYWDLTDLRGEIHYSSNTDYQEQFRELFMQAVENRLSTQGTTAVLMSGGLDSTSVFALSKRLEMQGHPAQTIAISGVFNEFSECDERSYIRPLLNKYNAATNEFPCDGLTVFKEFPDDSPWTFEPHVPATSYGFTSGLLGYAKELGASRVLTGCAGDHVLTGTPGMIADLVGNLSIMQAASHARRFAEMTRGSVFQTMWTYGIAPLLGRGFYKELIADRDEAFIRKLGRIPTFAKKDFYRQWSGTRNRVYMDRVIAPLQGIEVQHPLMDRRLVEFLYQIPGEKLWNHGSRKEILRLALHADLPEEILTRTNKTVHLPLTYRGLTVSWPKLYPVLSVGRIIRFGWISKKEWLHELAKWRQGFECRENIFLLVALEIWLYRLEQRFTQNAAI
ncbi:asparagine synthetase B (glutamine-hydrolysing) [Paenibacillus cellulosilyticus]|uniref:asparagine synthase (glutamine-hydrolyzing) n=1 Tax=Paenibacillus cellulosilyticus TaxID=375489 RepID=A0A2V2YX71_9BACL|nr:asparagine synthetase B family protein [Paenibacillus cellulosilyticus]PWV95960.1 asparagine synthetase B (glutamine-hydrolysing) [Paenibacillus cellulosilyticus]QKS48429.1 asparagine synthase [Paenibacillus cellulosilyticus]